MLFPNVESNTNMQVKQIQQINRSTEISNCLQFNHLFTDKDDVHKLSYKLQPISSKPYQDFYFCLFFDFFQTLFLLGTNLKKGKGRNRELLLLYINGITTPLSQMRRNQNSNLLSFSQLYKFSLQWRVGSNFHEPNIILPKCSSTAGAFAVAELQVSLYAWIAKQMITFGNHHLQK